MPVCMEVADQLGCKVVIAGAPSRSAEDYAPFIGSRSNVELIFGRTYDILKYAQAAIIRTVMDAFFRSTVRYCSTGV